MTEIHSHTTNALISQWIFISCSKDYKNLIWFYSVNHCVPCLKYLPAMAIIQCFSCFLLTDSHRTKHFIFTLRSLYDLYSQCFYCFGLKILFFAFAGRKKVKDYGVTSCVVKNVNKYNFSEGYRTF